MKVTEQYRQPTTPTDYTLECSADEARLLLHLLSRAANGDDRIAGVPERTGYKAYTALVAAFAKVLGL